MALRFAREEAEGWCRAPLRLRFRCANVALRAVAWLRALARLPGPRCTDDEVRQRGCRGALRSARHHPSASVRERLTRPEERRESPQPRRAGGWVPSRSGAPTRQKRAVNSGIPTPRARKSDSSRITRGAWRATVAHQKRARRGGRHPPDGPAPPAPPAGPARARQQGARRAAPRACGCRARCGSARRCRPRRSRRRCRSRGSRRSSPRASPPRSRSPARRDPRASCRASC